MLKKIKKKKRKEKRKKERKKERKQKLPIDKVVKPTKSTKDEATQISN